MSWLIAERYLDLGFEDRREVLDVAASALGRPSYLIEKDIWVVWAVETLFASSFGTHLVFKGGTSLSKAYRAIRRFSEDIDLTYDIRVLQPELVLDSPNALPPTRSQEKRWTKAVNESLRNWIGESVFPQLEKALRIVEPNGNVSIDGSDVYIRYEALNEGTGYGKPEVKLEFGRRATGEPNTTMRISCDASDPVKDVEFPSAQPLVLRAERTFWEKATAAHVYCAQHRVRSVGFARHWHDLVRLDEVGIASNALKDRLIANEVAAHKAAFFREKDSTGNSVDYRNAVSGGLRLVPSGEARIALAEDYERMVDSGWLFDDAETFDTLMDACLTIEELANQCK